MPLVAVIALTVFLTHWGVDMVATTQTMREELYYVARGLEGVVFLGCLAWYAKRVSVLLLLVISYGMFEEALTVYCGIAYILEAASPDGANLCAVVSGWARLIFVTAAISALIVWDALRRA